MEYTQGTTDQGYHNRLPPIQTIFRQHLTTVIDGTGTINSSDLVSSPTYNPSGSGIYPMDTNETQNDIPPMVFREQFDPTKSQKIKIKFQPRQKYHPRTSKECEKIAHYIRCEEGEEVEYPTIYTIPDWKIQSKKNYIEVALVDIFHQLHPYIIGSKETNLPEDEQLIVRSNDKVSKLLRFHLTDDDFDNCFKTFKIELIKSKQNGDITKKLIRERELEKSKLRFTRTFYDENNNYHRDEASTVYSRVMTECYGGVAVEHVNPEYGPMGPNQLLDVVFTGLKGKDKEKVSFKIVEEASDWIHDIKDFRSTGNTIHFRMPAFPFPRTDSIKTSINVYYEGKEIYKAPYVYVVGLDAILDFYNLNNPVQDDVDPTTLNSSNGSNQALASSSCSSSTVPKNTPKTNSRKRRRED